MTPQHRDQRTGRYARRPVPEVDATSEFNPMADSIEDIENVSGEASANTVERPRHAPGADNLTQGGSRFPPHPRHPTLVSMDERAATQYGTQGALTRDAARLHGLTGMLGAVLGVEPATAPSEGVRQS